MNFKLLLSLLIFLSPSVLSAQVIDYAAVSYDENAPEDTDARIHKHVDLVALYEGCDQSKTQTMMNQFCTFEKIKAFVQENIQYPAAAKAAGIGGKVKVWAVVETDGTVNEVRIKESDAEVLEAEAIRLVKAMPRWVPGKLKQKTVRSFKEITISFELPK